MEITQEQRRGWLAVLARAPREALARVAGPVLADYAFEWLRRPETGLTMVRARIANGGDRFNLGEATVTRCALRHAGAGGATVGVGYVLGRDAERAEWVAGLDALLQQPALHAPLMAAVIAPLAQAGEARAKERHERAARSRVHFYTLQRGDAQ
ncbi:phosphonate C-P lyase system protein PhnG [Pseudothauera rhizosphaerae]|uniref:Phosphonate C-P lyase system protein PhnG n=1 Tax=Pseudothauera rhizosphaerae TaxID=2565932 RepID=A0A4S4AIY3_9RHOO|nr:phosphonate C-P lyase system protein PhnG [Pseudothauera rhizosphaerae]THF59242.1 phosphonate C-P lyase system protein PhnG [Pseudothauera rhizosphaerae]